MSSYCGSHYHIVDIKLVFEVAEFSWYFYTKSYIVWCTDFAVSDREVRRLENKNANQWWSTTTIVIHFQSQTHSRSHDKCAVKYHYISNPFPTSNGCLCYKLCRCHSDTVCLPLVVLPLGERRRKSRKEKRNRGKTLRPEETKVNPPPRRWLLEAVLWDEATLEPIQSPPCNLPDTSTLSWYELSTLAWCELSTLAWCIQVSNYAFCAHRNSLKICTFCWTD